MTEVYVPNSDEKSSDRFPEALAVAENIHNGMCVSNLSAYVWWYIRRQYGPMNEDGSVSKRGAMMAQYSKWIRPGAVRIAATEFPEGKKYVAMDTKNANYGNLQTMVSAYKKDDQITVVAINPTPSAKTQSFTIKSGETISGIEAYHTTGSENFRSTAPGAVRDDLRHQHRRYQAGRARCRRLLVPRHLREQLRQLGRPRRCKCFGLRCAGLCRQQGTGSHRPRKGMERRTEVPQYQSL